MPPEARGGGNKKHAEKKIGVGRKKGQGGGPNPTSRATAIAGDLLDRRMSLEKSAEFQPEEHDGAKCGLPVLHPWRV